MIKRKTLLFLSLIIFFLFIYFSYLVAKQRFIQLDFNTTIKLQDHLPRLLTAPSLLLTLIGSIEFSSLVWLSLLIFALLKKWWLTIIFLLLFPLGLMIELYGKTFVHHPSPPQFLLKGVLSLGLPKYYISEQFAYPSGHMFRTTFISTFLLGLIVVRHLKQQMLAFWVAALFLLAMAVTRIFLGEHWLSDVIGGLLLGLSFGLLTWITIPAKTKVISSKE